MKNNCFYIVFLCCVFCFLGLFLVSCGNQYQIANDHIRISIPSDPSTLNPMTSSDAYATMVNNYIFDTLIEQDKDTLDYIPHLAEKWEVSKDKTTYTFYLRKDVFWHDGKPFTAEDVVYSFNTVFMNPELKAPALKSYYKDIKKVYKVDDYTVRFEYSKIYFRGLIMCGAFPVVPRHIVEKYKDFDASPYSRHPIGTGPYKFKEWVTNSRLILERNENYWGPKPEIKTLEFKVVADSAIGLQILKKGELDVSGLSTLQWARQTNSKKFHSQYHVLKYPSTGYSYIAWNNKHPIFEDKNVRTAMTQLLNRKKINEKINFGLGNIVTGPFFVFGKQYNKSIKPLPYDVAKAKTLLKEAGWEDKDKNGVLEKDGKEFRFTYLFPSGSKFAERVGTIYKEELKRVGIDMKMTRIEWAAFVDKLNTRDFDVVTLAWTMPFEGDPYQVWDMSQASKQNSSNFISFKNIEASKLIREARKIFDEEKRNSMYHAFHAIIHEEQPYTFLYNQPNIIAVSKRFGNVKTHTAGLELREWTIVEDKR